MHNCLLCEAKEGRNLSFGSGLMQLHNHYSVCLYNRGQFTSIADPGEGNKDFEGKAVDEYGRKFSYKCPVPECPRSISKAKPMFQGVGHPRWRHSSPGGEGDGGGGCEDSGHERGVGRGGEGPC